MHFYFTLLGIDFPGYSLMILLGLILANTIAVSYIRKYNLVKEDLIILEAYVGLGAIIGAKLLYLFIERNAIDWSRMLEAKYFSIAMKGGFVFYGGLIGGLLLFYVGGKLHKINYTEYIKRLIFLVPFTHAFGRFGCFMAGCCYGMPYSGPFAVHFPESSLAPHDVSLFPIQLLEATILLCISVICFFITYNKNSYFGIVTYLVLYSISRFTLEFLRYDTERGKWLLFSTSQWISIGILILLIITLLINKLKKKRRQNN